MKRRCPSVAPHDISTQRTVLLVVISLKSSHAKFQLQFYGVWCTSVVKFISHFQGFLFNKVMSAFESLKEEHSNGEISIAMSFIYCNSGRMS